MANVPRNLAASVANTPRDQTTIAKSPREQAPNMADAPRDDAIASLSQQIQVVSQRLDLICQQELSTSNGDKPSTSQAGDFAVSTIGVLPGDVPGDIKHSVEKKNLVASRFGISRA